MEEEKNLEKCTCDTEYHEPHSCPFEEDVEGNDDPECCDCCPYCAQECADSI